MITARLTRLLRVPDLAAYRRVILGLCGATNPGDARGRAVIVPSRAAAEQIRRSLEDSHLATGPGALVVPHLVTRDEWVALLQGDLDGGATPASRLEREVLLGAAARAAIAAGATPPFTLRAGLVAEMLDFYDGLRRHLRTIDDLERVAVEELERAVDSDRGAVRMLDQTRFLVAAFRAYETQLARAGLADEHTLRRALLERPSTRVAHVVVAVGDRAGDATGLWPADFDLLTRVAGLGRLDVVATEAVLASGFLQRVRTWLPGVEEVAGEAGVSPATPQLAAPDAPDGSLAWRHRDREEELAATLRRIKAAHRRDPAAPLWRTAVVFKRPLPYVYLARQLCPSAGVPFQTFDALPLAAEPVAAVLDAVFACVESGFSRTALTALLRSPWLGFEVDGHPLPGEAIAELDRGLSEARYLAEPAELARLAARWADDAATQTDRQRRAAAFRLAQAASVALAVVDRLGPLAREAPPTVHLDAVLAFFAAHERQPAPLPSLRERHLRARAAILTALARLREAHARLDDSPRPSAETAAAVHRWIERQTFAPRHGDGGVQFVDANAARFGMFDTVHLVGLTDRDWPESPGRSIFYPMSMLANLGWPADADVRAAERAAFEDLVGGASRRVVVSTITLEDDAIVEPSPFLEDLGQSGLPVVRETALPPSRIFDSDAMMAEPPRPSGLSREAAAWLALRSARTPAADAAFHGQADPVRLPRYRVSALDQYLGCPFSFFASHVLRLGEEPDDEEALSPKAQGRLVHEVLEEFFQLWQASGRGAVTVEALGDARRLFTSIVERRLATLPESDRALQRTRLIGSPVAPGIGDIVFEAEADHDGGVGVVERLLEYTLDGEIAMRGRSGTRVISLAAKADRIDLMADGTFRVIDYKLSRAPDLKHVVQLPAYAAAARQRLDGHLGRTWRPFDAAYLAFGKGSHYAPLASNAAQLDAVLAEGEARLVDAVDRIERGEFPPDPISTHRCTFCPFSAVCRKDYARDE